MSELNTEHHPAREQHPFREQIVDSCFEQFGEPDRDEEHYHHLLASVQHSLEASQLKLLLSHGHPNNLPVVDVLDHHRDRWVFSTRYKDFWDDFFEEMHLTDVADQTFVINAHHQLAQQFDLPRPMPDWHTHEDKVGPWQGVVIGASRTWRHAQAMVVAYLEYCLEHGCSAAEAVDYWASACDLDVITPREQRDFPGRQSLWANNREVHPSTVSEHVNTAEEHLATATPFEETEAYAEFIEEAMHARSEGTDIYAVWQDAVDSIATMFSQDSAVGCSPAQSLDYWMVERRERTQLDWAKTRGVGQSTISKNVTKARDTLMNAESTFKPSEPDPEQERIRKEIYDELQAENDLEELRAQYEDVRRDDT